MLKQELNQQPNNNTGCLETVLAVTPYWHKYCRTAKNYMHPGFSLFPFQASYSLLWKCETGGGAGSFGLWRPLPSALVRVHQAATKVLRYQWVGYLIMAAGRIACVTRLWNLVQREFQSTAGISKHFAESRRCRRHSSCMTERKTAYKNMYLAFVKNSFYNRTWRETFF
jgi:hypothetical protein